MSAARETLEYIYNSMKEVEFLTKRYLEAEDFNDYSTPIMKASQLVECLLQELLREKEFVFTKEGIMKKGEHIGDRIGYVSPLQFCANAKESPVPEEYKKFLRIIIKNRNEAVHVGKKTKAEMLVFSKAYNCFVCWFFESFDIFGEDVEYKGKIHKIIDELEKIMGAPIVVEYVRDTSGVTQRLLKYYYEAFKQSIVDDPKKDEKDHISGGISLNSSNKWLMQFFDDRMNKINERLDKMDDKLDEVHERLDNVTQILSKLSDQVSSYQELVQRQIELAVTEDEIDRIVHAYSEECVGKIIKSVTEKYPNDIKKEEEKKLIASLGRDLWEEKLTTASKNYLVSSKVTYNYYLSIETLDYSGVCLLVTKALEVEMSKRFYEEYVDFLKTGYTDSWDNHLDDFPTTLLKTNYKGKRVLKSIEDFSLGAVAYVLCAKEDQYASEDQQRNNKKRLVEFAKEKLMRGKSDEEILTTLANYGKRVASITKDFRNKAAHIDELGRLDAEACFEIVLDTEQLLKVMLDSFDH